jgi:hypothetical protein
MADKQDKNEKQLSWRGAEAPKKSQRRSASAREKNMAWHGVNGLDGHAH